MEKRYIACGVVSHSLTARDAVMESNPPDFYMGSTEHRDDWAQARACWVKKLVSYEEGGEYLLIQTDPPVIGQPYGLGGRDITDLIISPHYAGTTLLPLDEWPVYVYVYRILNEIILSSGRFEAIDVQLVAWCELYPTREEAENACRI